MNLRITQNVTKIFYSASGTPSCAGLLDLRLVVLPAAWGYQAGQSASRLESPELKSPPVGQSESYKHLGLISGLLWSLDKSYQSLLMFLELKVGLCTER